MKKILSVAVNTFREAIRDRILLSIVITGFLLLGASKMFVPISIGQAPKIIKDFGISIIEIFSLLLIVFVGTRIVYQEIDRKTIYSVITKPITEFEFLTGKFLGLLSLTVILQISLFAIFALFSHLYLGAFDLNLLPVLYFFIFEFLFLNAIALFFSSFSTPIMSAIFTLLVFFAGNFTDYLKEFVAMMNLKAISPLVDFAYYILPNFSVFNVKPSVVHHLEIPGASYFLAFSYSILYTIILLILSSWIFSRKEYQ